MKDNVRQLRAQEPQPVDENILKAVQDAHKAGEVKIKRSEVYRMKFPKASGKGFHYSIKPLKPGHIWYLMKWSNKRSVEEGGKMFDNVIYEGAYQMPLDAEAHFKASGVLISGLIWHLAKEVQLTVPQYTISKTVDEINALTNSKIK